MSDNEASSGENLYESDGIVFEELDVEEIVQEAVEDSDNSEDSPLAHALDTGKQRTADILMLPTEKGLQNGAAKESREVPAPLCFADFQLSPALLRGLSESGFTRPSPVQMKAIPLGKMGLDLIVQAKSGTGKTVVFSVVVLEAVNTGTSVLQALILSPTREIALQSQAVLRKLGKYLTELKCHLFVGGLPLADDLRRLSDCHVAVGTPGRVRYLIEMGYLQTEHIRHLVLDEADLLLAGGADAKLTGGSANNAFPADINYIWWSLTAPSKQVMALSATYSDFLVEQHLQRYMNGPAIVRMTHRDPTLLGVRQFFCLVHAPNRTPVTMFSAKVTQLSHLLNSVDFQQCLIFTNLHSSAHSLCDALQSRGWPVSYISSNLDQEERFRAYKQLRAFHCRVLVSTDLTSRGIDAENVNLVVSLEVPWEYETYLHRVGRAGRFGSYGASVMIVTDSGEELTLLKRLQAKCPSQIRQLPDPIPADLAAPDCQVDLDSLVTVLNCPREEKKKQKANNKRSSRPVNNTSAPTDPTSSTASSTSRPGNEPSPNADATTTTSTKLLARAGGRVGRKTGANWNSLADQLSLFLAGVEHLYDSGLEPTRPIHPGPDMKELIQLTEQYCLSDMRASEGPVKAEEEEKPKHRKSQGDVHYPGRHQREAVRHQASPLAPVKSEFEPPTREPPKHTSQAATEVPIPQHQQSGEAVHLTWSRRQLAAWEEYHRLLGHAQYFYSTWQSARLEYDQAVQCFSQSQSHDLEQPRSSDEAPGHGLLAD